MNAKCGIRNAKVVMAVVAMGVAILAFGQTTPQVAASAPATAPAKTPTLHIDADKSVAKVNSSFYGLMTEEINFSYDGGLYAELIRNRVFKEDLSTPKYWSLLKPNDESKCAMSLTVNLPLNAALPVALKLDAVGLKQGERVGVANEGYWGIPVKPKTTYKASFYAKASLFGSRGPFTVTIESNDGKKVFAKAEIAKLETDWRKYDVALTTGEDAPTSTDNRFVISTTGAGSYWFTLVSLFPPTFKDRPNGTRIDLMEKMIAMTPKFLRFPGGNYLEGDTIEERFDWKNTIGPIERRSGHASPWKYPSTDGMGLLEFLEWAEDMKAEPVLAVFAGYSLTRQNIPAGPELQVFVQEALDEIEYVTGSKETKWGAQRVADGHPEPFPLRYIEIGNEDWFDRTASYEGRFAQFYDAIKAKYPEIQLIATTKVKSRKPDMVDDHYYKQASEFERMTHTYDKWDRNGPKVFVGEWATREGAPTTNFNAALGDAAWMTGMERNADVVQISCYAPLLVNVNKGGMQWPSDLIGFDALSSYGSPSYYAQVMFGSNLGDTVPATSMEDVPSVMAPVFHRRGQPERAPAPIDTLFYSVTKDSAKGTLFLKVVNTSKEPQALHIVTSGKSLADAATITVLSAEKATDTNTIAEPTKIVPKTEQVDGVSGDFTRTFAPLSITVLKLDPK